jgi:hypothetical protein
MSVTEKSLRFFFPDGLAKDTEQTLVVGGVNNPRSFKPTGIFSITTIDMDGIHLIDEGYEKTTTMSIAAVVETFAIEQTDFTNGAVNTHNFALSTIIPVVAGDKIVINVPSEIKAPTSAAQMDC